MTPRQKRKHIDKMERARIALLDDGKPHIHKTLQDRRTKSIKSEAKRFLRLTATGKFCQLLSETEQPQLMLGCAGAHMQFYAKENRR